MATERGGYDFLVLSVEPENKRGVHVYEKMGFVPTGEMDDNEMIMRYDLPK